MLSFLARLGGIGKRSLLRCQGRIPFRRGELKQTVRNIDRREGFDGPRRHLDKRARVGAAERALKIANRYRRRRCPARRPRRAFIQKVHAANDQVQYGSIGTGSRGTYLLKHLHETGAGRCIAVCDNWDVNLAKGVATAGNNPSAYPPQSKLDAMISGTQQVGIFSPGFLPQSI